MNKKQVIRINENQLRQIVTESVKSILEGIGTDKRAIKDLTAKAKAIDPDFNYNNAVRVGDKKGHRYDPNEKGWSVTDTEGDFYYALNGVRNGLNLIKNCGDKFGMHPSDFWNSLYGNDRINQKVKKEISNAIDTLEKFVKNWTIIQAMENNFKGSKNLVAYHTGDDGKLTSVYSDYYDEPTVNTGKVYNPFTETYEKMNLVDAKKLALKYAEQLRADYGNTNTVLNDAGYEIEMDMASKNPVEFLNFFAERYNEPEDWYERNEHGDFDEY